MPNAPRTPSTSFRFPPELATAHKALCARLGLKWTERLVWLMERDLDEDAGSYRAGIPEGDDDE